MKSARYYFEMSRYCLLILSLSWVLVSAWVMCICWCFGIHCTLKMATGVWLTIGLIKQYACEKGEKKDKWLR